MYVIILRMKVVAFLQYQIINDLHFFFLLRIFSTYKLLNPFKRRIELEKYRHVSSSGVGGSINMNHPLKRNHTTFPILDVPSFYCQTTMMRSNLTNYLICLQLINVEVLNFKKYKLIYLHYNLLSIKYLLLNRSFQFLRYE